MNLSRQVILILIDGMRPDALQLASTPAIDRLIQDGVRARNASTVSPEISLPCITSLFFSIPPQQHGILDNTWQPFPQQETSLIDRVKEAGLSALSVYSWEPLRDLSRPDSLDFSYYHRHSDPEHDGRELELAAVAADYLVREHPDFAFIYIELPDLAGHQYGWMSPEYLESITRADRAVELIMDELGAANMLGEAVFLVTADHGGHDHTHGHNAQDEDSFPEDLAIPWILSGSGVRHGFTLEEPVSLLDSAPTLAHLLGLQASPTWQGKILLDALES